MTKKIFYEKIGRKYVPVSEYDSDLSYALPKGSHLITVHPGGQSTYYNVNPALAPMIAASKVAEDAISTAILKATELRRQGDRTTPLTTEQKEAWENLVRVFGDSAKQLEWPSARECAEAGAKAIIDEAEKLMTVPSVKKAYEHFMLVAELTKGNNESSS
jgi:hypothetical protein